MNSLSMKRAKTTVARIVNLSGAQQMPAPSPWMGSLAPLCHKSEMQLYPLWIRCSSPLRHRLDKIRYKSTALSAAVINNHLSGGVNTCVQPVYFWKDRVSGVPIQTLPEIQQEAQDNQRTSGHIRKTCTLLCSSNERYCLWLELWLWNSGVN